MKRGLYIHIPFCRSKCGYCDFNSYAGMGHLAPEYVDALITQMQHHRGMEIDTVFLGGGTPTALDRTLLSRLMEGVFCYFDVDKNAEITTEANPCTITREYANALKSMGINRVSMGAQTFDDDLLGVLGRKHNAQQVFDGLDILQRAGIDNLGLDIMYGLPGQTLEGLKRDILTAAGQNIRHLSCYALKIEEGTPFYTHGVQEADQDLLADMYNYITGVLPNRGFAQYELSNFAKEGYACRHNLKYWQCAEYAGIGADAAGYLDGVRYTNTPDIQTYIKTAQTPVFTEEITLSKQDIEQEKVMLGLRLMQGVKVGDILALSRGKMALEKHKKLGLLAEENGNVCLCKKGYYLSNSILCDLL